MRASYSSAIANALLDEGIYFDHVYGVSAGSSNAVNYLSRDTWRTFASFTTFAADPKFGGKRSFLMHKGAFSAHYIYQEAGLPGGTLPYDFATFSANPAKVTVASFERDTGRTRLFTKDEMDTLDNLMVRVRASSTLPIAMPPATIDGQVYYDGGLGEGNGILIPAAVNDGFSKFFIVRTRPRDYRKSPDPAKALLRFFWRRPHMQQALREWGMGYNAMCDLGEELQAQGRALVVYAEDQACENSTTDVDALVKNYEAGAAQAQRDMPLYKEFLGIA